MLSTTKSGNPKKWYHSSASESDDSTDRNNLETIKFLLMKNGVTSESVVRIRETMDQTLQYEVITSSLDARMQGQSNSGHWTQEL